MKTLRALLACPVLVGITAWAQDPVPVYAAPPAAPVTATVRSTAQLEQLVAPVALYPDALLAIMFPAATAPTDIVLAARQLREQPNDRSQVEHRGWDESVKSLTAYPEVLGWMDENLDWTKQLGEAFATQPAEVMQAVQRLRTQARANGVLTDTPQQTVIAEADVVRIVPAQPNVIYVPYYEPDILLLPPSSWNARPYIGFSLGVAVGSWLAFDCDWRRHTIWVGDRHRPWTEHDWRRPLVVAPVAVVNGPARPYAPRPWRPTPRVTYSSRPAAIEVIRPLPLGPNGGHPGNANAAFSAGQRNYAPAPATAPAVSAAQGTTSTSRGVPTGIRPLPGNNAPFLPSARVATPPASNQRDVSPSPTPNSTTDQTALPATRIRNPRTERSDRGERGGSNATSPANPPTTVTAPAPPPTSTTNRAPRANPTPPPTQVGSRAPAPAPAKPAVSEPAPATTNSTTTPPPARNDNGRSRDRREN